LRQVCYQIDSAVTLVALALFSSLRPDK